MNPIDLPELFKPTRDLNFEQKCEKLKFQFKKKSKKNYSTGEPHMCIFFFWDILVGILVLPHSDRDGRLRNLSNPP